MWKAKQVDTKDAMCNVFDRDIGDGGISADLSLVALAEQQSPSIETWEVKQVRGG